MAKSKMKLKYKSPKRERNKNKNVVSDEIKIKSFFINLASVLLFIGLVYLGTLGLKALGVFDPGYTKPTKEATKIDYEYILAGTVFDRTEKEYYVIFDDFEKDLHANISDIVSNKKLPVYKVDMSKSENALFKSEESNTKAKDASELKINDVTVIKFKDHKIAEYITGVENIEAKFK